MQDQSYRRGVLYIVLAGVFLSTGGLFVRFVEDASPWTVLFYRSLTFTATVFIFMAVRNPGGLTGKLKAIRVSDLIISASLAFGFITYVLSLFSTTVANTVLILSTGPVFAAILGWLVLRERVSVVTWLAMVMAFAGVAVMVSGGIAADDVRGIIYAFLAVFSFAIMIVMLRRVPATHDSMAATALAGVIAAFACAFVMPTFSISLHDLTVSMALGCLQVGMGFILITLGSRSVPSAQVPLLALAETGLSPLWVWLLVNETPARNTLLGGAVVLCAVAFQGLAGWRNRNT